ncbi:hypothetical protein VdG2_08365 [Verticillium dahliae VDG2]|nr:hypothetical protein VdG2_08365 [Verticillium dahliae VDG2]
MKSAKPPSVDGPSSRRSQPVRQARTNPSRVSNLRGPIGGRDSLPGASSSDQPIDIFPAVTHFADAITALPKELVRHFTLLKEVDAKIFAPEETLFNLVDAAMAPVAAAQPPAPNEATTSLAPVSATMSAQNSSTGVAHSTQAVQAKKNLKTQNHEMDLDDNEGRGKTETTKKGAKARKTAADAASGAGLGVTTNGATNGTAPQPKRRKVEKPAAATAPADRALAGVFGTDAPKTKTSSPRGTPAPEGPKKRKALPSGSGQAKKSRNGVTGNPTSATSSPVIGAFPDAKLPRGSPVPLPVKALVAARARQNSIQSTADANKLRPSSSASNKPNGVTQGTPDLPLTPNWPRPGVPEPKPTKETTTAPAKPDTVMKDAEPVEPLSVASTPATSKKELPTVPKQEEMDRKSEPVSQTATAATVTKSGRASKPSTPALPNFPDAAVRSRTSRNADGKDAGKRKKSTSTTTVQAAQTARSIEEGARNGSGGVGVGAAAAPGDEEEGDIDADEPRYCYCNSVSYGEMVACDADTCEREWFHLECVGLKVAPKGNAKWFCEPCKKRLTAAGKKVNGR